MTRLGTHTIVAALCGSVFLTACPGDDATGTGTETDTETGGDDSTSTAPGVTTMPPPTTITMPTDDSTTDDSTTGEPEPLGGYGDCANDSVAAACMANEICAHGVLGGAVCLPQGCVDASDCAPPAIGNAVPTCDDIYNNGSVSENECYLDCSQGESCPDGMACQYGYICVWELLPGVCPSQDLGDTVPQMIMGDTGPDNEHDSSCGDGGGRDTTYQFTASAAGTYVFDTEGSTIDTILSVLDGCAGAELACNDDTEGSDSEVVFTMDAGQQVILVVEGYGGEPGAFVLNITQQT